MSLGRLPRVAISVLVLLGFTAGPAMGQRGAPPSFAAVVEAVAPAVVTIAALAGPGRAGSEVWEEDEGRGNEGPIGSGVIIDPKGIVLTNAHVADGGGPIEVITDNGIHYRPTRVAIDTRSNLAVLIIGDGSVTFPHARLGDSDRARVGDWVVAIGTPAGLQTTVTAGIVSGRAHDTGGPELPDYIQTTAALRSGSSGGPLVDLAGEVVGINTILAFEALGLAFTIPSNTARRVASQLVETGRVSRPALGVVTQALTPELARALGTGTAAGLLVADVLPASPAAAMGLRSGDLLLMIDSRRLLARTDLRRVLEQARTGQTVVLQVRRRDGTQRTMTAMLGEERDEAPSSLIAYRLPELGCDVRSITPEFGVVITRVDAAATSAGLRAGDIVRELNNVPIRSIDHLSRLADRLATGDRVALLVQRGRVATYVALTAGGR
jgi:serine protease Do